MWVFFVSETLSTNNNSSHVTDIFIIKYENLHANFRFIYNYVTIMLIIITINVITICI